MDSIIGILKKDWWRLLKDNHFNLHPSAAIQALIISIYSINNSKDKKREDEQFGADIEATQISTPPLFILGHWRSGTTFLQNLMTQDPNFVSPNIFECRNPHTFLVRQKIFEFRLKKFETVKRNTDNVQIGLDSPGEEEFAVGVMSLMTPMLGWVFPKKRDFYENFLTFKEVSPEELTEWKDHYLYFLKKVTYKHQKPLLLKSPVNTARLKILIDLFPEARFVHIHRHPYDVFRSTLKMYRTAVAKSSFQGPQKRNLEDDIIDHYKRMHEAYFKDREAIPANRLLEIGFSQLESQPMETVHQIYQYLKLPGFNEAEPRFNAYLEAQKNYQKNKHAPLNENLKKRLQREWALSFDYWNYKA